MPQHLVPLPAQTRCAAAEESIFDGPVWAPSAAIRPFSLLQLSRMLVAASAPPLWVAEGARPALPAPPKAPSSVIAVPPNTFSPGPPAPPQAPCLHLHAPQQSTPCATPPNAGAACPTPSAEPEVSRLGPRTPGCREAKKLLRRRLAISKAEAARARGRLALLNRSDLENLYRKPLPQAAHELGVDRIDLLQRMRAVGIDKWGYHRYQKAKSHFDRFDRGTLQAELNAVGPLEMAHKHRMLRKYMHDVQRARALLVMRQILEDKQVNVTSWRAGKKPAAQTARRRRAP